MKKITKKQFYASLNAILVFISLIIVCAGCTKNNNDCNEYTISTEDTTATSQVHQNEPQIETTTVAQDETLIDIEQDKEATEEINPDDNSLSNERDETLPTEQNKETEPEETTPQEKPTEPVASKPTEPSIPKESKPKEEPTISIEETKPHTHQYKSKITKNATCLSDGVKTYTCACGDSYTEKIIKTNHTWNEWQTIKDPTCDSEGISQRVCEKCQEKESKEIQKLPPENPDNDTTVTKSQLKQIEDGFLMLVNEERKKVGVSELTTNSHLESVAQKRSHEIISKWSHTRPNGEPFHSLIDVNTYPYLTAGENLCVTSHVGTGRFTDEDRWSGSTEQIEAAYSWIFNCFKNSPGHYANMIDADFKNSGIGISYVIYDNDGIPMFYVSHIFGARQ